jgi:hypothetical protein
MVARLDFVLSVTLVAVTTTLCDAVTVAGDVYRPAAVMTPRPVAGLMDHVTAVFTAFVTVAVNCWAWPIGYCGSVFLRFFLAVRLRQINMAIDIPANNPLAK